MDLNEKVISIIEKFENSCKIDILDPYGVLDDNNDFVFTVDKSMLSSNHCDDK